MTLRDSMREHIMKPTLILLHNTISKQYVSQVQNKNKLIKYILSHRVSKD